MFLSSYNSCKAKKEDNFEEFKENVIQSVTMAGKKIHSDREILNNFVPDPDFYKTIKKDRVNSREAYRKYKDSYCIYAVVNRITLLPYIGQVVNYDGGCSLRSIKARFRATIFKDGKPCGFRILCKKYGSSKEEKVEIGRPGHVFTLDGLNKWGDTRRIQKKRVSC